MIPHCGPQSRQTVQAAGVVMGLPAQELVFVDLFAGPVAHCVAVEEDGFVV